MRAIGTTPPTTATKSKSKLPANQAKEDLFQDDDDSHKDNIYTDAWIDENLARTYTVWPIEEKYSWCHLPSAAAATTTPEKNEGDVVDVAL